MGNDVLKPKRKSRFKDYGQDVKVREAVITDAHTIAKKMRDADSREMSAHGLSPIQAASVSILDSNLAFTVTYCDEPVLIFGVSDSTIEGLGAVWAMGTYEIRKIGSQFLRHSKEWIEILEDGYQAIGNIVDDRNDVHRRWLEWCGFEFGHTIKYGPLGLPFTHFLKKV